MIDIKHIMIFMIFVIVGASMYAISHDALTVQKAGEFKATILEEVEK